MARHDPAAILGFLLIAAFAVLVFRVQSNALGLPDASGESLQGAKAEVLVEVDCVFVDGGDGERQRIVMAAAKGLDRVLHQLAADAVAVIAGQDANLRRVADAFRDGRCKDHADEPIAGHGPNQK
jgi:hypothetical protein